MGHLILAFKIKDKYKSIIICVENREKKGFEIMKLAIFWINIGYGCYTFLYLFAYFIFFIFYFYVIILLYSCL